MYLGDYTANATISVLFNTIDSTGSLVAMAGSPTANVLKNGVAVISGITPTAISTGLYSIAITFGANVVAGYDYLVVLAGGTIDGVSAAGMIVGEFSCENRYQLPNITGYATAGNVSDAQTAIIAAMPSTSGLATGDDIDGAVDEIIGAMPSVSGLATGTEVSAVGGKVDTLTSNLATVDGNVDTLLANVGTVDSQVDAIATAVNALSFGQGPIETDVTVTDNLGNPQDNVDVRLSTDEAGEHKIYGGITNAFGVATFNLDAGGTYYVWLEKAGYSFANPQELVVEGEGS